MTLAKPVKAARGLKSDAFPTSQPDTRDRGIETLEAKVDQLLVQLGTPIPTEVTPSSSGDAKDVIDQGLLTIGIANMLLSKFRATLMPHCPFVIISAQTTAETL
ncbi:hypothetical protein ACN38_g11548 [Penicillium nordicum]|uniref:Uncharacterized protein n=1 Tax=Penicillium nordicum TaxID=229535 RepID=A0A0M8NS63_9EURO|nr:hypothetical protein ACN38_g11548 [Penicillium nordicum]